MESVFSISGDTATPSKFAGGPWNASLQHGSAPASLIARICERIPTLVPMRVARLTIDLKRPVPLAPLTIRSRVVREGKLIQLSEISLSAGDLEVVHASILKVRVTPLALPPAAAIRPLDVPLPDACDKMELRADSNAFVTGVSMRIARGSPLSHGPSAVWFRADRPIIAGEEISALMRAIIASDFSNGTSAVLEFGTWTFMNADLTLNLARDPVGEWILLDAESWLAPNGSGIAFANLADINGYLGRSVQSLVVQRP
jgi:hypothetical protein